MGLLDNPFWNDPAFWTNFWAEFIVGALVIGLVPWLVARLLRPKPKGMMMLERTKWEPSPQPPQRIYFRIANTSKISFQAGEVRWELFIPTSPGLHGLSPVEHNSTVKGGEIVHSGNASHFHYYGVVREVLFSGISARLIYSDLPEGAEIPPLMYYVISTPYGQLPDKVKRAENGAVIVSTAAVVKPYQIRGKADVTLGAMTVKARGEVRDREPRPDA